MNAEWACDFSYSYFRKILQAVKSNFELHLLSQAPQVVGKLDKSKLILRHDVDVSLKRALRMARIEEDFGIRAAYMVMTESSLYRVGDDTSRDVLQKIMDMGHEIGLHIDLCAHEIVSVEAKINSACRKLEDIIDSPVRAFSFHCPRKEDQNGPLKIGDRVNAYARELQEWYLSDSGGRWRDGEPLPKLLRFDKPLLQLLIHPIWWDDEHLLAEKRLQAFVIEETRGKPKDYAKALHRNIIQTINVNFDLCEDGERLC
jgi:hypothetical protein